MPFIAAIATLAMQRMMIVEEFGSSGFQRENLLDNSGGMLADDRTKLTLKQLMSVLYILRTWKE